MTQACDTSVFENQVRLQRVSLRLEGVDWMATINDLISQIEDVELRERIQKEVDALSRQKKFGLVFEDHIPECTLLYDVPVQRGRIDGVYQPVGIGRDISQRSISQAACGAHDLPRLGERGHGKEGLYPLRKGHAARSPQCSAELRRFACRNVIYP